MKKNCLSLISMIDFEEITFDLEVVNPLISAESFKFKFEYIQYPLKPPSFSDSSQIQSLFLSNQNTTFYFLKENSSAIKLPPILLLCHNIITTAKMLSRIDIKRKDFYTAIRRNYIEQRMNDVRRNSELDLTTPNDIAKMMGLPEKYQHYYTLLELLLEKKETLTKIPIKGEIQDESTQTFTIDIHIKFWKLLSEQLDRDKSKYDQQIGKVLLIILSKYNYSQVHKNTSFQLHLLNTLVEISPLLELNERETVIKWVSGAEGLRVIYSCIEDGKLQFPKYNFFKRFYKVLELGLKSQLKTQSDQAAQILQKILKMADWDDTFQLYQNAPGLMTYLCAKIQRYWKDSVVRNYSNAVQLLLDTYDSTVVDYGRAEVAYAAALLTLSPIPQNYADGITIFKILTQVDSKLLITFLLNDRQLKKVGIWQKICQQDYFPNHLNYDIRLNYFRIIHNILAIGQQHHIQSLCEFFGGRYQDIFQMFAQALQDNRGQVKIIRLILNSLRSILYYGTSQDEPHMLSTLLERRGIIKQILYFTSIEEADINQLSQYLLDNLKITQQNI